MCPPARKPLSASAWNRAGMASRLAAMIRRWMMPTLAARAAASSMISWAMWPGGLRSTCSAAAAAEPSALITDQAIRAVSSVAFLGRGQLGQQQIGPLARVEALVQPGRGRGGGHQTATRRTA